MEKDDVVADEREQGFDLLYAHSPILHLHLQRNLFDSVSELLVQLSLRDLLLLAALQRRRARLLAGCFHFEVRPSADPHDLLRIHNLGRLDVQIALGALLLAGRRERALHAQAAL